VLQNITNLWYFKIVNDIKDIIEIHSHSSVKTVSEHVQTEKRSHPGAAAFLIAKFVLD